MLHGNNRASTHRAVVPSELGSRYAHADRSPRRFTVKRLCRRTITTNRTLQNEVSGFSGLVCDGDHCVRFPWEGRLSSRSEVLMGYKRCHLAAIPKRLTQSGVARFNQEHSCARYIGSCLDITDRKLAEAALANVNHRIIEAQEQERTRIARELHDDIGQRLALLAINLAELEQNGANLSEIRSRIRELKNHASEIAVDVQTVSHRLHSSKLEFLGLAVAMRSFCNEFGEQQKVEIDFESHDLPDPLAPDISLCLFRVLQEALCNSTKHSGGRHFKVRSWGTPNEVHLTVCDFGSGFDKGAAKAARGLGLISMHERLKILNGTLSIESQLKRGTTIHASVPFNPGSLSEATAQRFTA